MLLSSNKILILRHYIRYLTMFELYMLVVIVFVPNMFVSIMFVPVMCVHAVKQFKQMF